MNEKVIVRETQNKLIVTSPGPQGPRGRTILNGSGSPANNLGLAGDFYVDNSTHQFYGPKLSDLNWTGVNVITLTASGSDYAYTNSWELAQVQGPTQGFYHISLTHNLGFYPNVTIKDSSGDIVETGIEYSNTNQIMLTMAQPFSGTAYLS
jgi:hypothetical protein